MTEKREKFVQYAETRVNKILDALESLSKLSDKRRYEYGDDDVKKMFNAISDKTKQARGLFENDDKRENRFSLS